MSSIEEKWFTWDDVFYDGLVLDFEYCTLLKDIYPHKKGAYFTNIRMDLENSELVLERYNDEHGNECPYVSCTHKLKLKIK